MVDIEKKLLFGLEVKPLLTMFKGEPYKGYYNKEARMLIRRMNSLRDSINKSFIGTHLQGKDQDYGLKVMFINKCVSELLVLGYDATKVISGYYKKGFLTYYIVVDNLTLWGGKCIK